MLILTLKRKDFVQFCCCWKTAKYCLDPEPESEPEPDPYFPKSEPEPQPQQIIMVPQL
jgi:hypothetical protein